jgi:hypothetical protein
MRLLTIVLGVIVVALNLSTGTHADAESAATGPYAMSGSAELVERFLAAGAPPLATYRARRTLTASTRGGSMTASVEAWTSVDTNGKFQYEITSAGGSDLIRRRVLIAALEEERRAWDEHDTSGDLTPENYIFHVDDDRNGDYLRIRLEPRRKSSMLVDGLAFVTHDDLDIVRIEGELSKRPSFWTRHVEITRHFARIGGVRVPIEVQSRADIRIVGASMFSMLYDYVTVNGRPVG